jgi:integrase/recombinase XerD
MARASALTDIEIRRVFRIIETTRYADRNRLAFVLSIFAGLRVGEIAALKVGDVTMQNDKVRREIKLGAQKSHDAKGRTAVLSSRVRAEIDAYLQARLLHRHDDPLIASQRRGRPFSSVSLSILFKEIYEAAGIRTSSHSGRKTFAVRLHAKGVSMQTIQKLMGHRNLGTTARYCAGSEDTARNAVELL